VNSTYILDRYSKYQLISNFIKIRPPFSDFAQARDKSSTNGRMVHEVDRCDVATIWRNSGNTKQSDRQWLWLNHTPLQPDVWKSDRWPCAAAVCFTERGGSTRSDFFSEAAVEPNTSAVAKNRDTMNRASQKLPSRLPQNIVTSENFVLLGCYAASSGNYLPTFRVNLSLLSSSVKNPSTCRFPSTRVKNQV
jgi:hypothetical protein